MSGIYAGVSSGEYQRGWRAWLRGTEGRCEAICSDTRRVRNGRRCTFAGAWVGTAGLVLCRVHERAFDESTGDFKHDPRLPAKLRRAAA